MIDRSARNRLAQCIRHYLIGRISNFQFDDQMFDIKSEDFAISDIRDALWMAYDDFCEHRNSGPYAISEQGRPIVLRCILFLKSDFEYAWPRAPLWYRLTRPLLWLVSLGAIPRSLDKRYRLTDSEDVWPFQTVMEIEQAIGSPKYLAGTPQLSLEPVR